MNHFIRLLTAIGLISSTALFYGMNAPDKPASKKERFSVSVNEREKRIVIKVDGKPFTSYIYPDDLKKPVLYPIRTAAGTPITRGWPLEPRPGERVDHPHHVGLWFNFGNVNGYDFWNNSSKAGGPKEVYGTIRHRAVTKAVGGKNQAELAVVMEWLEPGGTALIRENTTYIFSGNGQDRIIDRITTLTALEDVFFRDNKEGMFALRLARQLEQPSDKPEKFIDSNGNITNVPVLNNKDVSGSYYSAAGKAGDAVWGTRSDWVMLNGKINNELISIAISDHPENPGYPASWHARGYGLFGINPFGQKAMGNSSEEFNFNLPKGKSVTFRYRLIIHSGDHLLKEKVNRQFREFSKEYRQH